MKAIAVIKAFTSKSDTKGFDLNVYEVPNKLSEYKISFQIGHVHRTGILSPETLGFEDEKGAWLIIYLDEDGYDILEKAIENSVKSRLTDFEKFYEESRTSVFRRVLPKSKVEVEFVHIIPAGQGKGPSEKVNPDWNTDPEALCREILDGVQGKFDDF